MGGSLVQSIGKVFLSVSILIVSLLMAACGKSVDSPQNGLNEPAFKVLGIATPSKDLEKDWNKAGIPDTCFQVGNTGGTLNEVRAYAGSCDKVSPAAKPFAVLEAREWINPEKIGQSTGEYILYTQFLPVGEMKRAGDSWSLEDLCQLDGFYRSACQIKVADGEVTGLELNATASADRVRMQKQLEAENETLKNDLENDQDSLTKLNALLTKLSGQIQSQKDAVQAVVKSFEPALQKEEAKVNELLIGRKGEGGIEAKLATAALEVRDLSASLEAIQKETAPVEGPYLAKLKEIAQLQASLEAKFTERSAAKKTLEAADSEEKVAAAQAALDKISQEVSATALKLSDAKDEASKLLVAVKAHPSFEKEVEAAKHLAESKKRAGELLNKVGLVRAKLNAVQVAKSHVATVTKLLRENRISEAAMVLPALGKFVDRAVSITL